MHFRTIVLCSLIFSGSAFADDQLRLGLGFSGLETKFEAEAGAVSQSTKAKGAAVSLGLNIPLASRISLDSIIGYGEAGQKKETRYYDRFLKILPRYTVYQLGTDESIYVTAGLGAHQITRTSEDLSLYSGIAGIGFKHDNPSGMGFGFGATYEQSFNASEYKVNGLEVKNVKLSVFEYSLSLHTSL